MGNSLRARRSSPRRAPRSRLRQDRQAGQRHAGPRQEAQARQAHHHVQLRRHAEHEGQLRHDQTHRQEVTPGSSPPRTPGRVLLRPGVRTRSAVSRRVTRSRIRSMSADFPMFALSEEHRAVREAACVTCVMRRSRRSRRTWTSTRVPEEAAAALLAADSTPHVPEEYGGAGADALATVIVIEEVARACASSQPDPGGEQAGVAAGAAGRIGGPQEEVPRCPGSR